MSGPTRATVDRAALVRRALVELVAERGIHGTSMSQVADHAGVATGTAYVHYESKEELLIAAFVDVKRSLGQAGLESVDAGANPRRLFETVWRNVHDHLRGDPAIARFLVQLEASPLREPAHAALLEDDPLTATAHALAANLVELPIDIIYDLGLAPAVRLVASGLELTDDQLDTLINACWMAVSR